MNEQRLAAAPEAFERRVLLCVTGLTPQIVMETLYALCVARETPFVPTEIVVLTTREGAQRVRLALLDEASGQFHAFCREYELEGRIAFSERGVRIITDEAGQEMDDIRTPQDNARAADLIVREVRAICADEHCAVHASIAGGRKTMGFYLGYAMSLFARPQDRLSHVLVTEPFESLPAFHYPPRTPRVLYARDGRPVTTADARVMLAEIPVVRLRDGLPHSLLAGEAHYSETVEQAQRALAPPSLEIDLVSGMLRCGEVPVRMQPLLFAWYAWFAHLRSRGLGQAGFVRYADAECAGFRGFLCQAVPDSGLVERTLSALQKDGMERGFFEQKKSRVNAALRKALGTAARPYEIVGTGKRSLTRYGLALDPAAIRFADGGRTA